MRFYNTHYRTCRTSRTCLTKVLGPVFVGFVLGFGTGLITYCWVHIINK